MSGAGKGFHFNEGDWTCAECSNVNFARRSKCNRCGTERKYDVKKIKKGGIEIGKQAAEKSKGLFSAEDWMCKTCGNVNWARRGDCNMCFTPKVDLQEERTGFGGGFNERAGVEYKEKEDSDGEYDDFGRRKKKYRGNLPAPGVVETSNVATEEDEEESGDDEDVSKYDLDADDDEDDEDIAKYDLTASEDEGEKKSDRSKSRSRSTSRGSSRDQKDGRHSSSSRSNSSSQRRRRSKSSSSSSSSGDGRGHGRHGHKRRRSRSHGRSRSPHHRRSGSRDGHNRRH